MPRTTREQLVEPEHVPAVPRVAVVDGRDIVRRGLADLLKEQGYAVVLSVERGEELLTALKCGLCVDLAVVHRVLEGLGGQATLALLAQGHPAVRVLAVCDAVDDIATLRAYDAGVRGVMRLGAGKSSWAAALADARAGRVHLNEVLERLITGGQRPQRAEPRCPELTARELETIQWFLCKPGSTQREVAEEMGVDVSTVHEHLKNIYRKWGVHHLAEALLYALHHGLYPG